MKRLSSQNLAWKSFICQILDTYFTRIYLIKAFVIALSLCAFIYSDYFGYRILLLNSLFALVGFWLLLGEKREVWFWSGFFTGIFWFYWISFSFIYYDLVFMIPLIVVSVALFYALLFWIIGYLGKTIYIQALLLLGISFIEPFGFNWLKIELPLLHSYFKPTTLSLALIFIGIILLKTMPKGYKLLALPLFIFTCNVNEPKIQPPLLNVALPSMHIPQSQRWDKNYQHEAILLNFKMIEEAIEQGKELIVLPESAFPLYLNREEFLVDKLLSYSNQIAIITGSLTYENEQFFNSSYFFYDGKMEIAHKIVLVPFGEEVPFPEFLVTLINKLFFDGAKDYAKAKEPYDFKFKEVTLRSAICFEATKDKLYEGNPKHMIAISNNAWFSPSIEQTLQYLLLEFYAKKYNTVIYHSANAGKNGVIVP
ncbi:MAG: apolipoprotein N-acyltransferase [Sulfurospirillum sp.]|nr:apolipoprotein N-acyltransferase [Sulfurospirillum sp.]MBP9612078.1 apolipoprotein N-acyltransferase [Sulfurospirillum sp.]